MVQKSHTQGNSYRYGDEAPKSRFEDLNSWDWDSVFMAAAELGYDRDRVAEIIKIQEGENEVADWLGLFVTDDNKFLFVTAWCDYTGFDCQSGGSAVLADSLEELQPHVDVNDLVALGVLS